MGGSKPLFFEFAVFFEKLGEKSLFLLQHHPVSSLGKYSFSFSISIFPLRDVSTSSFCLHLPNYFEHYCKNRGEERLSKSVLSLKLSLCIR